MITVLAFAVIALVAVIAALYVVRSRNLVHAVLWLGLVLLGTAALYALLDAPFLAGIQVLTYVGGVVTLMIFGVMVTRRHDGSLIAAGSVKSVRGFVAALAFFGVMAAAILNTEFPSHEAPAPTTTRDLGRALLVDHVLAFETASVLLLAAIVGAIVLVRRREAGREGQEGTRT